MILKKQFPHGVDAPTPYIYAMSTLMGLLFGAVVITTLVVLVVSLISFAMNGSFYKKHANQLMRLRVLFQGLAVILLGLSVWLIGNE